MTKQVKKTILAISTLSLLFSLNGCGGAGGGNGGATSTSQNEQTQSYIFKNTTTTLNIQEYRPYEISFQLTQGGLAQAGASVTMQTFDNTYGTITSQNILTDENGIGTFTYNPPKIKPNNDSATITYIYNPDANTTLSQDVTIDFKEYIVSANTKTTALSLVYMSTIAEDSTGKIINRYRVHAVDNHSNQPRVGIPVTMSLINQAKIQQNNDDANGTILDNNFTFTDNKYSSFSKIDSEDTLIILPTEDRLDAAYLGGWAIDSVLDDKTLQLFDKDLNVSTTDQLQYIIGDEVRLVGDDIAVADVINVDNESTTDEDGYIVFDVTFDPKLAGHTVTLEAHGDIDGQRVGVSTVTAFRYDNINAKSYVIDDLYDETNIKVTLQALINNTEPLSNLQLVPSSFHSNSSSTASSCLIKSSNYTTDDDGNVVLYIDTTEEVDDNQEHVVTSCTISWDGGMNSIIREY